MSNFDISSPDFFKQQCLPQVCTFSEAVFLRDMFRQRIGEDLMRITVVGHPNCIEAFVGAKTKHLYLLIDIVHDISDLFTLGPTRYHEKLNWLVEWQLWKFIMEEVDYNN